MARPRRPSDGAPRPPSRSIREARAVPDAGSAPGLDHAPAPEDEDGRIGIFPSWRALYIAVIVYTAGLIGLLHIFTVMLDTSAR